MMTWTTFKQRVPSQQSRVLIWMPQQRTWELASLTGSSFTLLSGHNVGTVLSWREVSHFLEVETPNKEAKHHE